MTGKMTPMLDAKIIIRDRQPGDLGHLIALHGGYYAIRWGLLPCFEAEVAEELGAFARNFRSGHDGLWLAGVETGGIAGGVAIQALEPGQARLRWFILDEAWRGRGIGDNLLRTALDFCREAGHRRVTLHTFKGLDAAQALYRRHGFTLEYEREGAPWGPPLMLQAYGMEMHDG